jgi:hypothetical protein
MQAHASSRAGRFRAPQRISLTLPQHVVEALLDRSAQEGRSLSNLSAYLLECSLQEGQRGAGAGASADAPQPRLIRY